jgi:hypothetical protein
MTTDWLNDTFIPAQSVAVLEDMEAYTSDPNTYKNSLAYTPEENSFGLLDLSIVTDPNAAERGQVLRVDYNFNGKMHAHIPFRLGERRVNSSLNDHLPISFKKTAGSNTDRLILDFYDGRGNLDPIAEGLFNKGRLIWDISAIAANQWVTLETDIPTDMSFSTCTDLYQIMVSIEEGGLDTCTVFFDRIELSDSTTNCAAKVGEMVPDMNGDCIVNLMDFAELAKGWLNGI